MISYIKNLLQMEHPFRYLLSRFLVRTKLCKFFIINTGSYKLHYYPTAISSELWQNPSGRQYEMLPYIKKGDIIVDVGANIGTTVIPSAMAVEDSGRIIAFEAHPVICKYLSDNIKLNKLNNVTVHNFAIGEKKGTVTISDEDADDQNNININKIGHKVKSALLDDFTAELEKIDLLKIDVEGYELFVLQGAVETLKKTECINIEISEEHFSRFGYSCSDVITEIMKAGFKCFKYSNGSFSERVKYDYVPKREYENIVAKK